MERNHNPQVVTIAVELYKELLAMANTSPRYTTKRIDRHARKFNPHLQPAHQERTINYERERSELIRAARALVSKYTGKVMYAKTQVYLNSDQFDPVYTAVIIRRVNPKERHLVEAYVERERDDKFKRYHSMSALSLIATLPEGYIEGVGNYSGRLVKENGDCDLRESIARRDREREERRTLDAAIAEETDPRVPLDIERLCERRSEDS